VKQLSGFDAAMLYMETSTTFCHVAGLMIFETPSPDFDPHAAVYAKFASLVGELEPLRRRLKEVPLGLDHPYWVADADVDLGFHIRKIHLARPGMVDQLAELVSRLVGQPMDRSRPLWEVYVIDRLQSGRWALLSKYHHATIDGAAGQIMVEAFTDVKPDAPAPGPGPSWELEPLPRDVELLRRAVGNLVTHPFKAMRLGTRIVRQLADSAGIDSVSGAAARAGAGIKAVARLGKEDGPRIALPITTAPPTPWNKSITAKRRFAMCTTSLNNVKRLKDATGGTVNDIILAICAGGLRQYLLAHDALPDRPLRAMVPVSVRTGEEEDPWTNRVSAIAADLPTDCADPLERITRCREAMLDAKRRLDLVPATQLMDVTQFSTPVLATAALRLLSRLRLADRIAQPFNLLISNVPGSRQPLYFAGAQLCHTFPVSIVADGQGLNITVASYLDRLDFGFIVDRELVPDVWHLADMHLEEIGRLFEATGAEWAEPPQPAAPRRVRGRRASATDPTVR
jgi:diacylglycerol O-acyltransferase